MLMWQLISTASFSKYALRIEVCKYVMREICSETGTQITERQDNSTRSGCLHPAKKSERLSPNSNQIITLFRKAQVHPQAKSPDVYS
jgi:hypothetical protein